MSVWFNPVSLVTTLMRARQRPLVALVVALCALDPVRAAAQTGTTARAASPQTARAQRVSQAPTIDGILNEELWQKAVPLTDFLQAEPLEGQPASQKTEVRLVYDDSAMFVGVRLHDADPSRIVVTDTSRDAGMGDQDSFQIILDTFRDRQNGFVFGTSATGVQYDAQVRNQGVQDATWDASWEVKTQSDDHGWTAEFRIPLRTLRYGQPPQAWGVNFMRNIQRERERAYWAPLPRQFTLSRLSSAGDLQGLQLAAPRNFKLLPYAVTSANRNFTPGASTDFTRDIGLDAKVGVTGSLNLDLTLNTDFAQVEVDNQQINLTRFNIRFPEKRPFFLENAGLFTVGASAVGQGGGDLDLFFSRRIGLDDDGNLVPMQAGARLSGKTAGYNVGLMNMQTDSVGRRAGDNFTVARVSRDLPSRSGVGAMFINRSAVGELAGDEIGIDLLSGLHRRRHGRLRPAAGWRRRWRRCQNLDPRLKPRGRR